MYALRSDFFDDVDDLTQALRPRRKSVIDRLIGRMAVGQIFGEQYLYEVHGPFVPPHRQEPRRSLTAPLIEAVSSRLRGIVHEVRMHRAAREMACLDDRMLKDIGISRSEIAGAVRRVDPRT